MRGISNLTSILYSIFFLLFGALLVLIASNIISKEMVNFTLDYIYANANIRWMIVVTGAILIILSVLVIQVVTRRMRMERTIAFDNPDGQVTISLGAIEDFIKRLTRQLPEIKELKPTVISTKKGVDIMTRLVLYSDSNIPELTEKIQGIIKGKVQEILGVEESVSVRVYIAKIVQKEESKDGARMKEKEPVQFRGIEY